MKYCLIEKWHADYSLPRECKVVPLTTEASDSLEKCGVDYVTFQEYFSSGEVRGDTDGYLDSQRVWFREFDRFVWSVFPEAEKMKVRLPSLYFYNIKHLVDCAVLTARIINKFLDVVKPDKVWFIPKIRGSGKMHRWYWYSFDRSAFAHLLEPLCRKRGIAFEELYADQEQPPTLKEDTVKPFAGIMKVKGLFTSRIRGFLKTAREVCAQYPYFVFFSKHKKGSILVVNVKNYLYDFCRDCRKNGFSVFLKNGDYVRKPSLFPAKEKIGPGKSSGAKYPNGPDKDSVMDGFIRSGVMDWINERCGLDVSSMMYPRFKYVLCDVFPETLSCIKSFVDFYNRNNIDFVVNYSLSSEDEFAAAAAAAISDSTKSVGFSHGTDAYEAKPRFFLEYNHYDFYFVNTKAEADHIKGLADGYGFSKPSAHEYPYFRKRFSRIAEKRSRAERLKKTRKQDKPIVLFAPVMRTERMHMPIVNTQPLQWDYFRWHYALIDYFASRSDFRFVWKALLQPLGFGDTIRDLLQDKRYGNISFSSDKLSEWMIAADRILCDVPGGAFYESIFSGIPTLAFYRPKDQELRKDAYHVFGPSLQPYSTIEDGIKAVEDFLDSAPKRYIVTIPQERSSVPGILMNGVQERQDHVGRI